MVLKQRIYSTRWKYELPSFTILGKDASRWRKYNVPLCVIDKRNRVQAKILINCLCTKYGLHNRRSHETNNTTCVQHLFMLVLYYQSTTSFNLLQSCMSWILYTFNDC